MPRLGRIAVGGAIAAGLVLRFVTRSQLWLDEALSVDIARLPIGDIPAALRHDGHPPLYYVLLHGWMQVFGEGDIAVRALSGVLAIAALPLAWLAGRRAGGRAAGWWMLGLFALSPFAVRYATETRMYALVSLLVLGGYLLVRRALDEPRLSRLVPVAVVSGLLLLTHYWALWFLAAVVVVLGWHGRRSPPFRTVAIAVLAGGIFLLPWLPSMLSQSAHTGTPWADPVRPTTMVTVSLSDLGGGDYAEAVLLGFALLALFVVGLAGRAIDDERLELDVRGAPGVRLEAAVVGLTLIIATAAGYITHTTFASRYIAVVMPLFLLVAAVGAARLPGRMVPLAALAGLLALGGIGSLHNVVTERTEAGVIADAVKAGAQPGDVVVICPDQLGPALHRQLPASMTQLTYPSLGSPDLVDWRDYAKRNKAADPARFVDAVVSRASGAPAVWLVASGSYKTLEGQCESVGAALSGRLGAGQPVVAENPDSYFEHASLTRFPGPAPASP